jgi:hypothetical protein
MNLKNFGGILRVDIDFIFPIRYICSDDLSQSDVLHKTVSNIRYYNLKKQKAKMSVSFLTILRDREGKKRRLECADVEMNVRASE